MPDWKALARALAPDIPADRVDQIAPTLEALAAAFRPLARALPHEAKAAFKLERHAEETE